MSLGVALIGEASKAICHALTTLLWPLVTFVSNIAIVTLGVLVLAHYFTLVASSVFSSRERVQGCLA